eukprot:UN16598
MCREENSRLKSENDRLKKDMIVRQENERLIQ